MLGVAEAVAQAAVEAGGRGAPVRLEDPALLAIDADHARLGGEVGEKNATPVADAGPHVEREARRPELVAAGHEGDEVVVPPEVARLAEVIGGVELQPGGLGAGPPW